jgi:DNA-binding transcriptional MerR regulator
MISEAANRIDVEAHVLRYWQRVLALPISRNEMEQRYYKESDIELLKKVKHYKEKGFQLKAIKMILSNIGTPDSLDSNQHPQQKEDSKMMELFREDKSEEEKEGTSLIAENEEQKLKEEDGSKMGQFRAMMNHIIMSALKDNNGILSEEIGLHVTDGVIREMNYLMRLQEEKEEERYRKFDASLREYQRGKLMTAATTERKHKKSKFMKKNKIHI